MSRSYAGVLFALILVACGNEVSSEKIEAAQEDAGGVENNAPANNSAANNHPTNNHPADAGDPEPDAAEPDAAEPDAAEPDAAAPDVPGDATPPLVVLSGPRAHQSTASRQVTVSGVVSDDEGVASLTLVGPSGELAVTVGEGGAFSQVVTLAPGANALRVRALDAAGNEGAAEVEVYFGHRISVGNSQGAFLRSGQLTTWGRNELGQLGNGTLVGSGYGEDPETAELPAQYEVEVEGLVSVVTRQTFMIALNDAGRVLTWGSNESGQLGYAAEVDCGSRGASPCRRTPTEVPGVEGAVAVQAGFEHSLVLLEDGTVVSFGDNARGQLGYTTAEASSLTPAPIPDLSGVVQLAAGASSSFALTDEGEVFAWGQNDKGQLGLGSADADAHPTPTRVEGLTGIVAIASANTTTYALREDGAVLAWGRNHNGQAGNGDPEGADVLAPTPVLTQPEGAALTDIEALAGDGFVGLGLSRTGQVFAWGWGFLGQLGQGYLDDGERDLESRPFAVPVLLEEANIPFNVVEVEIGAGGAALALTADGDLFGWGWSFRGSLGLAGAIDAWAYTAPILITPAE